MNQKEASALVQTLDQFPLGAKLTVTHVRGEGSIRRRLMDMGVVAGVHIEVVKIAPLGDPIEYKLRGYHLSLRKAEAKFIEVEQN